jgi:hypothetical protein
LYKTDYLSGKFTFGSVYKWFLPIQKPDEFVRFLNGQIVWPIVYFKENTINVQYPDARYPENADIQTYLCLDIERSGNRVPVTVL